MSKSPNNNNNGFLASESDITRLVMSARRLPTDVPHIIPVLDNLPPSSVVCEVGCGPGGITLDIAQRYPRLIVLGIDIDEDSIEMAKENAEKAGTTNVRYAHGDAVNLSDSASLPGFEALRGGCSLVYTNATVQHCPDQPRTVSQLRAACAPNGTVSMCEGDTGLSFAYPMNQGMQKFYDVLARLSIARGAEQNAGRRLLSLALNAGFKNEDITDLGMRAAGSVFRPDAREYFHMGFQGIFESAMEDDKVNEAKVTQEEVDLIKTGLDEWSSKEDSVLFWPAIVLNCVKREDGFKAKL